MKLAFLISGTIRYPQNSLKTLDQFRADGHEIDVFLHTYKNIADTDADHWSAHHRRVEPTPELLAGYRPAGQRVEDWPEWRVVFQAQLAGWQAQGLCPEATRLAIPSMFYGIEQVAQLAGLDDPERLVKYDCCIRLRFDGFLGGLPEDVRPGWVVPSDQDFAVRDGDDLVVLNDRLGLFFVCPSKTEWSLQMFWGYAGAYRRMDQMLTAGCPYHPESVLKESMVAAGAWGSIRRRDMVYAIHRDIPALCCDMDGKARR